MVPAGFENAGVPGSPPGVPIEDDERTTQPCAHRAGLCSFLKPVTEETDCRPILGSHALSHANQQLDSSPRNTFLEMKNRADSPLKASALTVDGIISTSRGNWSPIQGNLLAAGCLIRSNESEPTDHRLDEEQ